MTYYKIQSWWFRKKLNFYPSPIRSRTSFVIPAEAGIQFFKHLWTPASAGVTRFLTSK